MSRSIIIIGSGMGGLSAGCYARRNGFRSVIYEKNDMAGGLCTAWKRKGYTFDGCIHWLVGTQPGTPMYQLWEETGALDGQEIFYYDYFTQYSDLRGNTLTAYCDPEQFRTHLLSIAPEDGKLIRKLTGDIETMMRCNIPVDMTLRSTLNALPLFINFMKYRMPVPQFAAKFKNPLLRDLFSEGLDWHGMPSVFTFWTMALMGGRAAGYPVGGSRGVIESILRKYEASGGEIRYGREVDKILVEKDRATGVRFTDGTEEHADYVLSAADGRRTIFSWLEGRYSNKFIRRCYDTFQVFPGLLYLSLGVNRDLSHEAFNFRFRLRQPVTVGNREVNILRVTNHWFDPTLKPSGKSILTIMVSQDYDYWKRLAGDRESYLSEKSKATELLLAALEERLPGIRTDIECLDLATPVTFERYTGNFRGSYQGWILTSGNLSTKLPQQLPGLSNFYMAGHWIAPGGGLPAGLTTGRSAIRKICRQEGVHFR